MKNILLIIMASLSIQLQSQTLCSYGIGNYAIGTQSEPEVVFGITGNNLPIMAPLYAHTTIGQNTFADSCFGQPCSHLISNTINVDTITTYLTYTLTDSVGSVDTLTCSLTHYWDGSIWQWTSESSLGIDNIEPATASVYPNPASDVLNISLDKGQLSKIELYSMTGQLLFREDLNSKAYALNIGNYSSSLYLVRVFNQNNDILNTKFLKE
ncbi:MAG: T9SS type A sorting domain-containing protein [Flavobacteriales bacterium]|nr:T9SS type A sorting domain-containing protein [Flavobacteriales bacterium]